MNRRKIDTYVKLDTEHMYGSDEERSKLVKKLDNLWVGMTFEEQDAAITLCDARDRGQPNET